jgi:hypothetical protein
MLEHLHNYVISIKVLSTDSVKLVQQSKENLTGCLYILNYQDYFNVRETLVTLQT